MNQVLLFTVVTILGAIGANATCSSGQYSLCCMGVAPYSSNSAVWGGICGFNPPDNPLVGARCIAYSSSSGCPSGTIGTCCNGVWPSQCGLGTYCGGSPFPSTTTTTTTSATPSPTLDSPLATGWMVAGPCMVLNNASDLNGVRWSIGANTPERCTAYCQTAPTDQPPHYTYAAVGGDATGCYCGFDTDYNPVLARRAYDSECNLGCAGDTTKSCGRWDRVQVYTRTPWSPPALPAGWTVESACAVDNASRVLQNVVVTQLGDNAPAACASYCRSLGTKYTFAGVEYSNECHCGTGWKGGVVAPSAPTYDCTMPCQGNPTDPNGCGGAWRIQVYKYSP